MGIAVDDIEVVRARGHEALPLHALLVVAALTAGIATRGAYDRSGQLVLVAVVGVAGVIALRRHPFHHGDARLLPLAPALALASWALVSAALAGDVGDARPVVGLVGGVVVVLLVARRTTREQRVTVPTALIAVAALAALTGWAGVAFHIDPWALVDQGLWRAATTLTYSNAAAGLLVPIALLGLARLVDRPTSPVDAAAVTMLLIGAGATLSRGGALALAVGGAALVVLVGPATLARAALAPVVGAAIALAGLTPSMPADQTSRPVLAALALALGLAVAAGLVVLPTGARRVARLAAASAGLALLGLALISGALDDVRSARFSMSSPDRAHEVEAALDVASSHLLSGAGPGQADLVWTNDSGQAMTARYAHNEYVQVLAEMGVVGAALLVALLVALAIVVGRGRSFVPTSAAWAGLAAGLVALAIHSALDYLWHLPVLPLTGALLVGLTTSPHPATDHHQQETA